MSMITLIFISALCWTLAIQTTEDHVSACDDFYDYVCRNNVKNKVGLKSVGTSYLTEIDQHQGYIVGNGSGTKKLWDAISPVLISKWYIEMQTFNDGTNWKHYNETHKVFLNLSRHEQIKEIETQLSKLDEIASGRFYIGLKLITSNLRKLKLPMSRKNPFYHDIFNYAMEKLRQNIEGRSSFTEEEKQSLLNPLNQTKIFFGLMDHNNVSVYEEALTAYEKTYWELKGIIRESDTSTRVGEIVIRTAAIEPAIEIIKNYVDEFSGGFLYQCVIASSTKDCFNYNKEIFISVLPRYLPGTDTLYTNIGFPMCHEILHSIYDLETFEKNGTVLIEKECLLKKLLHLAQTDRYQPNARWNADKYIYEDFANMEGIRLLTEIVTENMFNETQLKSVLEGILVDYCKAEKNTLLAQHNPAGISFNAAISQLPIFKTLYQCKAGDRMYVSPEDTCVTMKIAQNPEYYEVKKVDERDFSMLSSALGVLENTAEALVTSLNITENESETPIVPTDAEPTFEAFIEDDEASGSSSEEYENETFEQDYDEALAVKVGQNETSFIEHDQLISSAPIFKSSLFIFAFTIIFH